jgi:LmbE family N-acetylglucosaminyl deacetylase
MLIRSDRLKKTTGLFTTLLIVTATVYAGEGETQPSPPTTVLEILASSQRVLWLAAHPDDETSASGLLARSKEVSGSLFMATLTKGENSDKLWGGLRRGSQIGAARAELFEKSASLLQADGHDIGPFINGPHSLAALDSMPATAPHRDWSATATSDDVIAKWSTEGDPVGYIVTLLRQRKPDVVVAMDDHCGVSGHDEHIAVARLLLRAIPIAADPSAYAESGDPWQVQHVIFSAQVIPQLMSCRYCKCEGAKPADPVQEVFSLDPSSTRQTTFLGVQCMVAKLYQNAVSANRKTDAQVRASCEQAQAAAKRAYRPGMKGQPFFEPFRVRPLS